MRFLIKKKLLRPFVAGAGYAIPVPTGAGSTYYVSTTGNDSHPGSPSQPWLTPAKAISSATTPGDVVIFRDGTYTPVLATPPAGASGTPITWVAENAGGAIFDGLYRHDFGLLLENCNYFHLRGFDIQNYCYGALWSNANNSTSTYTEYVTIDYCYIHHNGREPRSAGDTTGYVGMYTNGMTRFWNVDKCAWFMNGRKPNHDFDYLSSGDNHNYRHDHGWYCQGYGHVCNNNYFFDHTSGYPIRTGGYWKATALTAGEYSVEILDCKFYTSANESPYGDVHGLIGVYNNLTAHGGSLGTTKEGVLRVENCVSAASQAGTGTNTLVGFFNDPQSYGSTSTTHRIVNNTVQSTSTYNEGESWMSGHTGITASGNTTSSTVSAATLASWVTAATALTGKTARVPGAYPWNPFILPLSAQAGWWDARQTSTVTEVSSLVSNFASRFYVGTSFAQGTAADRPDYVSGQYIAPLDSTDFMNGATALYDLTNGNFTFAMVGSDNKLSAGGWIRLTNYTGGGNGFKFNHFGSSWFAYYDQGGGGQSGSFSSTSYTANTDVMFSFKHDAGTDFEVFENGTSRLNFTPAAGWASTDAILFPTGGGVGMDKCRAIVAIKGDATAETRQFLEGFLAWEYGLQGSLAGVHPWDAEYPHDTETVPAAFTSGDWSVAAGNSQATVTIATLPDTGGYPITRIDYRVDAGTWTNSGVTTATNFNITSLAVGTTYTIELRAVNLLGAGTDSDDKNVTTNDVPSAFIVSDWSIAAGNTQATVTISTLPSNGGSGITDIEYRLDAGSWVSSGTNTTGTFDITSLSNGTTYAVDIRAVNANGAGADSDDKNVTPAVGSVPATISYVGQKVASSDSWVSVAIGAADANRAVFALTAITALGNPPTALTIGGISATLIDEQSAGPSHVQIWVAKVPTGTTANIQGSGGTTQLFGSGVFTFRTVCTENAATILSKAVTAKGGGTSISEGLTAASDSFLLAATMDINGNGNITLTGVTTTQATVDVNTTEYAKVGHSNSVSGSQTIGSVSNVGNHSLVAASFDLIEP